MNQFEKINGIWSDLDGAYRKLGRGMGRIAFMRALLGMDTGETGVRALLTRIHETGGDEVEVEKLCMMVTTAYKSMKHVQCEDDLPESLNQLCVEKRKEKPVKTGIESLLVTAPNELLSISESIRVGSALPVAFPPKHGLAVNAPAAREYFETLYSESEIVALYERIAKGAPASPVLKALMKLIKAGKASAPMVVTDLGTIRLLEDSFSSQCLLEEDGCRAVLVEDKYSNVCALGVQG